MARKKRKLPEVNSSSSADIAFLLLIFFLVTTSMDTDRGLARRLPQPVPKDQKQKDVEIKQRNVLPILVNTNNQVAIEGIAIDVKQLRARAKEFIQNPYNDPKLPEMVEKEIPFFGRVMCSKGVISLQTDRSTEYQVYFDVQNELVAAYNELRNEKAKEKWGKLFDDLDEEQRKAIIDIYPQNISEAEPKNYGGK